MNGNNEKRMSNLLDFPYGSFLMVRFEFVRICGDELEAKVLRIIEMYTEDERTKLYREFLNTLPKGSSPPDQVIEITKDVWTPISHRTFLYDLYGAVKSENTLKRVLQSLLAKNFIRTRPVKGKHKAPEYQINTDLVGKELARLQTEKQGYQPLIPSKIDTIKNVSHQPLIPSGYQKLTPSHAPMVSKIDPPSRSSNYENKTTVEEESITPRESVRVVSDANASAACAVVLPEIVHQANSIVPSKDVAQRQTLPPSKPQDLLVTASPRAQQVIADWQAIFPKSRKPITKLLIEAAEQLALCDPTAEDIATCRLWLYKTDKNRWYASHGMSLGDLARNWEKWQSTRDAPPVQPDSSNGKTAAYVSGGKLMGKLPYHLCFWQGKIMPKEEAHDLGWNGGFEAYN